MELLTKRAVDVGRPSLSRCERWAGGGEYWGRDEVGVEKVKETRIDDARGRVSWSSRDGWKIGGENTPGFVLLTSWCLGHDDDDWHW